MHLQPHERETTRWTCRAHFHVYDTTLRDGAQQEGLNLSVADKLAIARQLDELGVGYIEGGWPGANPKDTEFFRRARDELDLRHATLAAFGATRRAGRRRGRRPAGRRAARQRRRRRHAGREVPRPARRARAAHHARGEPRDGPRHRRAPARPRGSGCSSTPSTSSTATAHNRDYALEVLRTAYDAGAEVVALCDTNGGMLPGWVADVVHDVRRDHRRPGRHPLPQRHRLRGRQHAGRGRRRRHPRAGHPQRLRRAHRQRRPGRGRRQPRAQAGPPGAARGPARATPPGSRTRSPR